MNFRIFIKNKFHKVSQMQWIILTVAQNKKNKEQHKFIESPEYSLIQGYKNIYKGKAIRLMQRIENYI